MTAADRQAAPNGKRVAFDLGAARIGVAASDELGTMAFARTVLVRRDRRRDLAALVRLVAEEEPVELVVGLPLTLDGHEGPSAKAARRFAADLGAATGVAVVLWDERLSTVAALEGLREIGIDARRAKGRVDAEAARIILAGYLEHVGSKG